MSRLLKLLGMAALAVVASTVGAAPCLEDTDLLHRWSFNGSLVDACGGNVAKIDGGVKWDDAEHPTGLVLPGGAYGTGAIDLGYDCATSGNEMTLEIWGQRNAPGVWPRIFDWGINGANYLTMTWSRESGNLGDCVNFLYTGTSQCNIGNTMNPFTSGTMFHISMRFVQRANGGLDLKWQKRDVETGALLREGTFGTDTRIPLAKFNQWGLFLGRSHNTTSDNDSAAVYDEVRIWQKALTDEQLQWSARLGPDRLPTVETAATMATVSVSTTGNGTVALNGGAAAATIAAESPRGTALTLVATPAAGSAFRRWTGTTLRIVAGTATDATITLDAARDVTLVAEFLSDSEPATATWSGAANNGKLADAANWVCRNATGEIVPNTVPTANTAITISGETDFNCPPGSTLAYDSLTIGDCRLKGDCDWRGLGAFTITGKVDVDGHTLRVARLEGSGIITSPFAINTAATVPAKVTSEASFWLDAADNSTITYNPNGEVATWTSKDANHVVASSQSATKGPIDGLARYGRPTVDFEKFGSSRDLLYPRFTQLRTVFWVVKIALNNVNHLLGDKNDGKGVYNFHRGDGGTYGNAAHSKFGEVWNGTDPVAWRTEVIPDQDFQVIAATMAVDSCSDSITADRNFTEREGGLQLSELVCFNSVLTPEDRTNVVHYLQQKWFGSQRSAGTVVLEVPSDEVAKPTVELGGNLKFVKAGAGSWSAEKEHYHFSGTELEDGTTVLNSAIANAPFGVVRSCQLTVGTGATLDVNGIGGFSEYPTVLAGGTVVNGGANFDGSGPFGKLTLTADSAFGFTKGGLGFASGLVDLGGHTLDVTTDNVINGFFAFSNTAVPTAATFTNGTLRVHGDGEFKIWYDMDARTADFDLDCPLWMHHLTTVRNFTYRNRKQSPWYEDHEVGEFRVLGVFTPVSPAYPRTKLLNGSTLDLSGQGGVWSTLSERTHVAGATANPHQCTFEENGTVTIDVHGRTLASGERVISWPTQPANVTFQWDAATQTANPGVAPFLANDGLYFGSPAGRVSLAYWTNAANDGNLANPANWNCTDPLGDAVSNGLPGATTTVRLNGSIALDLPVGSTLNCAGIEVENVKLTRDCDWRGYRGRLTIKGVIDLQGHQLRLSTPTEGFGGQIVSSYGFDPALVVPAKVSSEACFWLDAADESTLTVDAEGRVTAWRSKGTAEVTATPTNVVTAPIWSPYDYGRPCVDFGAFSSGKDLVYSRFTKLQTVFWVIKIVKNSSCHLLGDTTEYNFHRGFNGEYGNSAHAKIATAWNGTQAVNWSGDVLPDNDFQIVSLTMGQDCCSDTLTQDRNFADRNGGRQLCELICFESVLDDADRTTITQYLQQKWGGKVGANGVGELRLDIPSGEEFVNYDTKYAGHLKLVKEGEGTYNAAFRGQTYLGGTEILGGAASTIESPTWNLTFYSGANARCYGWGESVKVGSGATLDMVGNYDYYVWKIVLDGGTLLNRGSRAMNTGWGGPADFELTADSRIALGCQTVFWKGEFDNQVALNGHTLTIEMGAPLYTYRSVFTNGTVRLVGDQPLMHTRNVNCRTADFVVEAPLNLSADLEVRNYTAAYTGADNAGTGALKVFGVFTPVTDRFHGCQLQNGATLDISGRTTTFDVTSAFESGRKVMEFAENAAITVDIHGRTPAVGERLVAWTSAPSAVTFTWDAASAQSADQSPTVRSDGLYYGGEPDNVVTDAIWTGAAGDGNAANPANWTCRNAAWQIVEGGVPGAAATVHLSGSVQVDFPIGSGCVYRQLDFGAIKLTGDCDWRGLAVPAGARIDLDGHKLYLSELPASGSVTCALIGEGDNVGGEPSVLSEARLWLDAAQRSSLTLDANNNVQSWTSRDANHTVATVSGTAPTYSTTWWANGQPCIDFGSVGSGKDMQFNRMTDLRTVFIVTKMAKDNRVFLLGDTTSYNFHRGEQNQYCSSTWSTIDKAWNGLTAVNPGKDVIPDNAFQFITVTTREGAASNRICRDRTSWADRTGGKQVSELICFNRLLTDAERVAVTEYLQNKWLNGACHRGELHLDVPAGKTVVNTGFAIDQSVRLVKDGAGSYVASCANQTYVGGNEVTGGEVRCGRVGTGYAFGPWGSEMKLDAGGVFEQDGYSNYTALTFILNGGTLRNTGADLQDTTALGKIALTADSRLEATRTLSVWWDQHYVDLGGHTLSVTIGGGKYFTIGADTTTLRNGTLDLLSGGYFRVYHGALDASTVNLRVGCALDIANALTVNDYRAGYDWNTNVGNGIITVKGRFTPAAGGYFHGCELADGAMLDLSEQDATFSVVGAFSSGAKDMAFASDATAINVALGEGPLPASGKIVDWTGRAPANLAQMTFTLDAASCRRGRRLVVKDDGLYIESGIVILLR